jgi:hypothetical protein
VNRVKWNIGRAYRLWVQAVETTQICEAVGVSKSALVKYARVHQWPRRRLMRNKKIEVDPVKLVKRCPGCLSLYESAIRGAPHCDRPVQSIYQVAA